MTMHTGMRQSGENLSDFSHRLMIFEYNAVNKDGVNAQGKIEASTKEEAIEKIQNEGLTIINISEEKLRRITSIQIRRGISTKDIALFSRQIATLFDASVPAARIFVLMSGQVSNPTLRGVLENIASDIKQGKSVSESFSKHSVFFSPFYISMIQVGEESGTLHKSFIYLADYYEDLHKTTSQIRGALIYPAFIVLTFVFVMWVLLGYVIPKIATVLKDSGQELPFITQLTVGISSFIAENTAFLFIAIALVILGTIRYTRTTAGRAQIDSVKLRVPLFGPLFKWLYLGRIATTLAILLQSGVRLLRAIDITARVVENKVYERILQDAAERVKGGAEFSSILERHPSSVPAIFPQMIRIGEETGELGKMFSSVARFYDRALRDTIEGALKFIEPVLIIILGIAVSVLLASVLLPIYNISGTLNT